MIEYLFKNYPAILIGFWFAILLALIKHLFASLLNKQAFDQQVSHENKEKKKIILSNLESLANDLIKCWESAYMVTNYSKCGSQDLPADADIVDNMTLEDFYKRRENLINEGVFTAHEWHFLDELPKSLYDTKQLLKTKARGFAGGRCYWFTQQCRDSWDMVVSKYIVLGGNLKDLPRPIIPNE